MEGEDDSMSAKLDKLTRSELPVAELMNPKITNKEIASQLNVSEDTVKTHLRNIYQKLGITDRWQLYEIMSNQNEFRKNNHIQFDYKTAITGHWEGYARQLGLDNKKYSGIDFYKIDPYKQVSSIQHCPEQDIYNEIEGNIEVGDKGIQSEFTNTIEIDNKNIKYDFTATGQYITNNYFKFNYENSKIDVIQFGTAFLKLHPSATVLSGKFVGYGSISADLVIASIHLRKSSYQSAEN